MFKVAICYIVMLIMAFVFYIAFIDTLSLLLLITAIIFPFIMLVMLAIVRSNTDVSFVCDKKGQNKNADISFRIVLHNKTILPLPRVHVKVKYKNCMDTDYVHADFLVPLHLGRTENVTFTLSSMYCGKVDAYLDEVIFYDYISLFRLKLKSNKKCSAYILPNIYDLDIDISDEVISIGENDRYSQYVPGDDNTEIFSLRDYTAGDRISQIHWKLSSKRNDLIVKEYSKPINSNVLFLCDFDCGTKNENRMKIADALVEAIISLSNYMIANNFEHYAGIYSDCDANLEISDVCDEENCVVLSRKLLATQIYDDCRALKQFAISDEFRKYSHVIYLSHSFNLQKSEILENIALHVKTSVVAIDDKPYNDIYEMQNLTNSELPFYPLECSKIAACLSELVI